MWCYIVFVGVVYQASCIVEESSFVDQFALGSNIPEETVITISDDDLIGEDDEVTSAFSGFSYTKYCFNNYTSD